MEARRRIGCSDWLSDGNLLGDSRCFNGILVRDLHGSIGKRNRNRVLHHRVLLGNLHGSAHGVSVSGFGNTKNEKLIDFNFQIFPFLRE